MWLINLSDSTERNQEGFTFSTATSSKSMCMSEKAAQGRTGTPVWIHVKHEHIVGFIQTYFIRTHKIDF